MIIPNKNSLKSRVSLRKIHAFTAKHYIILILHLNNIKVNDFRFLKYRLSQIQKQSLNFLHIKNKIFLKSLNLSQISEDRLKGSDSENIKEKLYEKCKKVFPEKGKQPLEDKVTQICTPSHQEKHELDYKKLFFSLKNKKDSSRPKNFRHSFSDLNLTILFTGNTFLLGFDSTLYLLPTLNVLEHNKNVLFLGALIENNLYTHRDAKQLFSLEEKRDTIFSNLLGSLLHPVFVFLYYKLMIDFTFSLTPLTFLLERARDAKKNNNK